MFAGGTIARLPAGALVDRWSRRRVLMASNVASALVFGVLAVLVATGTAGIAVTVLGPSLTWADVYAIATAAVAREPAAVAWLDAQPGYDALLVTDTGSLLATRGWPFPD